MTYYNYVKRDKDSIVDWGSLSSSITQDLQRITSERQQKRAELDRINDEALVAANDVNLGQSQSFNDFLLKGSSQYKEFLLMKNRLLKKGLISPDEYSRAMQSSSDSWKQLSESSKNFNSVYADAMTRLNNGEMAAEEAFIKSGLFQFGNVADKDMFINPVDNQMYIVTRDKDGNIIKDPGKMISVKSLGVISNDKKSKFDVMGEVTKGAKVMAKTIESIRRGGVFTVEDARRTKNYKEAKENYINSLLVNPSNATSVLADFVGGYEFTYDESESGGNKILLKADSSGRFVPSLTEDQTKAAVNVLDQLFEAQIGKTETAMPIERPVSGGSSAGGRGRVDDRSIVGNLKNIYSGNSNQIRAALGFFQGLNDDVVDINRTATTLDIKKKDGSIVPVAMVDESGNPVGIELFIEDAVNKLTGGQVKDLRKAIRDSGITGTEQFSTESARASIRQKPTTIEVIQASGSFLTGSENIDKAFGKRVKSRDAAEYLSSVLSPFGIVIEPSTGLNEYITVSIPGIASQEFDTNNYTASGGKAEKQKLVKFLSESLAIKFGGREDELLDLLGGGQASSSTVINVKPGIKFN